MIILFKSLFWKHLIELAQIEESGLNLNHGFKKIRNNMCSPTLIQMLLKCLRQYGIDKRKRSFFLNCCDYIPHILNTLKWISLRLWWTFSFYSFTYNKNADKTTNLYDINISDVPNLLD